MPSPVLTLGRQKGVRQGPRLKDLTSVWRGGKMAHPSDEPEQYTAETEGAGIGQHCSKEGIQSRVLKDE